MRQTRRKGAAAIRAASGAARLARVLLPATFLLSIALVSAHQHADGMVPTDACVVCHAGGPSALRTDDGSSVEAALPAAVSEVPATRSPVPLTDRRRASPSRAPPPRPTNA